MDRDTLRTELDYDIDEDDFYWEESACREVITRLEDKVILCNKNLEIKEVINARQVKRIKELEDAIRRGDDYYKLSALLGGG